MKKNSKIFKKTYSTLAVLFIFILFGALIYKILNDGFKIDSISIAGIKIDEFYLKLDEKLILRIERIDLRNYDSSTDSPPKLHDLTNLVRYAVNLSQIFKELKIAKIAQNSDSHEDSSIFFNGKKFQINLPYLIADFSLNNEGEDILLDIETLKIKQENLDIKGRILYLEKGKIFAFDLESYINNRTDNVINYQGETNFKYLSIVLDSTNLNSIDILAPYIKMLDLDVYEWMFERAKYSEVGIKRAFLFTQKMDFENADKMVVDSLYASGIIKNLTLNFEDSLENIHAPEVAVLFENGKLQFSIPSANFKNTTAQNSVVEISDFLAPQVLLRLQFNLAGALLNNDILEILRFYEINLPLLQKSGANRGNLALNILLPSGDLEAKVTPSGEIEIADSTLEIAGFDTQIKSANLKIENHKITAESANLAVANLIDGEFSLEIDTDLKQLSASTKPRYFALKNGDSEIVNLGGTQLLASLDFSGEKIAAKIEPIGAEFFIDENIEIRLNLGNLAHYAPMLKNLAISEGGARLIFPLENPQNIAFDAKIANLNYPIYYLNKKPLNALQIAGSFVNNEIVLQDLANKLSARIDLEGGDIDIDIADKFINISEILDSNIPIFANLSQDSSDSDANLGALNLLINAQNLTLGLFNYEIPTQESMLKTTPRGFIANGKNRDGIANIILDNGTISLEANNFDADFINAMLNKDIVDGGNFGVFGIYRKDRFVGDLSMQNTSVKNMASLQNILSFIDTIPSLIVFKLPGFSASGYEIEAAKIRVGVDKDYVALENIAIEGSSVDIAGSGVVDLKSQDLNIRLELSTIKSLSSILNKIPIVGFLLLGDDGKITTDLTITGTLENPQTELSLLEDAAKTPLNILQRVFSPFQLLIDELQKESEKRRR